MRLLAVVVVATLLGSGCMETLENLVGPDYGVSTTAMHEGSTWNRENVFEVVAGDPEAPVQVEIRILAEEPSGDRRVEETGVGHVALEVPDGEWKITYWVDGRRWATLDPVRIDGTPPRIEGLERVGDATGASYTIGTGATIEPGASLEIIDVQTGARIGDTLPHTVTGLADGLHVYLVRASDEAGNTFDQNVQVRVGQAAELPPGRFTFGVVARYTNELRIWDISDLEAYLDPAEAAAQASGYLGSGHGIDPGDPEVIRVVEQVVTADMNTAERALALYRYMFDHLEYDEERLATDSLLTPSQVLLDLEDPTDTDADRDGLVRDGNGNDVRGGICRDLAATYVSLLRAAGVPARLVSGYLGGDVDGFHAWAEFYGGSVAGMDAWVPVDVSSIDGLYDDQAMLQAFGIRPADYLPLRDVPPQSEVNGWSTAISMHYEWSRAGQQPEITIEKAIAPSGFDQRRPMCVHAETRIRVVVQDPSQCPRPTDMYVEVLELTVRTLDYGVQVHELAERDRVHAEVAFPHHRSVAPDSVVFLPYGPSHQWDEAAGKLITDFTLRDL